MILLTDVWGKGGDLMYSTMHAVPSTIKNPFYSNKDLDLGYVYITHSMGHAIE